MPKHLLVTIDFPPRTGGVARYLDALATTLHKDVWVLASPEEGSKTFDAKTPYLIKRRPLFYRVLRPAWMKTARELVRFRYHYETVLVSHVLPIGTAAYLASFITRRPYTVILHGMDIGLTKKTPRKQRLATKILQRAKLVVVNSQALADEVKRDFGVKNVRVVYPCLGTAPKKGVILSEQSESKDLHEPVIRPVADSSAGHVARERRDGLRMTKKKIRKEIRLLTVSRLVKRKGHEKVLEALVKLKKDASCNKITYDIVGDGPEKDHLKELVQQWKLEDCVTLHGSVSDEELVRLYQSNDIFVMPTNYQPEDREGFGLVYIEAATHGLPSIATNHPGVDEAVVDGKTGILVEDGNIDELAEAIKKLTTNSSLRTQLGAAAKERAESVFTCEKQMAPLRDLL